MRSHEDLFGKTVFVTGGSGGLGKAISNNLAARGAHVSIFSRRPGLLADAKAEIMSHCADAERQDINAVAIDVSDAAAVSEAFKAQPRMADFLYCCAGGNHAENGFIADISTGQLDSCMKNNYYACVYPAKTLLNIWIDDDKKDALSKTTAPSSGPKPRKIVFINSAAAFLGFPGSGAYTPAKMAVRGLADTLRLEVLRHNCPLSTYTIHSAYPADFVSPGFVLEQNTKTPLTKRIQGLSGQTLDELIAKYPSSEKVAGLVIAAVDRGDFVICDGFPISSLLFTNMVGLTPKRGWGIVDSMLGVLTGWFVIPYFRRKWEAETRRDRA